METGNIGHVTTEEAAEMIEMAVEGRTQWEIAEETGRNLRTVNKIIRTATEQIAEKSSQEPLIDSIPADEWYEAKDEVITILEQRGDEGLATSILERKLKKYGLKDSYAKLIAELKSEGRIDIHGGSPNGGFKVRIPQAAPEPEGGLS